VDLALPLDPTITLSSFLLENIQHAKPYFTTTTPAYSRVTLRTLFFELVDFAKRGVME
jgi:hypothetical protein